MKDEKMNFDSPLSDYIVFENKNYIKKQITINDLFLAQYINCCFVGYDIVVQVLAIENYYGINNYGLDLYKKMYKKVFDYGMLSKKCIETDINFSINKNPLMLATSIFKGESYIMIKILKTKHNRFSYDLTYLKTVFTDEEIELINNKFNAIKSQLSIPYYFIIWPPAISIASKIENELNNYPEKLTFVDSQYIELDESCFKEFLYGVYNVDDVTKDIVDEKYRKMLPACLSNGGEINKKRIMILKFLIDIPDYKMKVYNGNPRSKATMRIKKELRENNKKYINDYFYDIVLHVTDNAEQNKSICKLLTKY